MAEEKNTSTIIQKLPAVFQEEGGFLDAFLKAFEDILIGEPGEQPESRASLKSIGYILENFHRYFNAYTTPPQFLEWLGNCFGYTLKKGEEYHHTDDLIELQYKPPNKQHLPIVEKEQDTGNNEQYEREDSYNRIFISKMVTLYQERGTFKGINTFINHFIDIMSYTIDNVVYDIKDIVKVRIDEYLDSFILGQSAVIGKDSMLGKPRSYYFRVKITFMSHGNNSRLISRVIDDIKSILEDQKPAHIFYYYTTEINS